MDRADIIVVVTYFTTMIVVGMAYSRRMKTLETFFAGGRQLSWWLGGTSFMMASVSALSIIVYAGLGYEYGIVSLTLYWTTVPATLLTTWLLALRWRRAGIITPTEFLESRFSPAIRQLFVWATMPLKIIDDALKIVAIAIFVAVGLHISAAGATIAVGLITLLYTILGGLWAVVITDLVQFILVTSVIILLVPITVHAGGGLSHILSVLPRDFFNPIHSPYTWKYIGGFFVLTTLSTSGNWSLIQRFYSARNDRECRGIGWFAGVLFFLLPPIWIVTGIFARALIPPTGFDTQTIYARLGATLLPPGLFGLVFAAFFAAAMSVIASSFNVTAAVLTIDVHRRLIRPAASERELVFVGRVLTGVVGFAALAVSLAVIYFQWTIFNAMVAVFGFFLPPTVIPMIAGLLTRRLSSRGVFYGFASGILTGLAFLSYGMLAHNANNALLQIFSVVASTLVTTIALLISIRFSPVRGDAAVRSSKFFEQLRRPAPASVSDENPLPVAGVVIAIMGIVLCIIGTGVVNSISSGLTLGVGLLLTVLGGTMWASSAYRARRLRKLQLQQEHVTAKH